LKNTVIVDTQNDALNMLNYKKMNSLVAGNSASWELGEMIGSHCFGSFDPSTMRITSCTTDKLYNITKIHKEMKEILTKARSVVEQHIHIRK
jgi:hypothetical protein